MEAKKMSTRKEVEGNMEPEKISTHRQCTVELENKLSEYSLSNPQVYTESGTCEDPLPPVLKPSESGSALFKKTPHAACGAVGVFMYELLHVPTNEKKGKIGVLYSNPYDFVLYSNWHGVGVFDMDKSCDYALYDLMYNGEEKGFVRGKASGHDLTYSHLDIKIKASMSDEYQPVIKIQFLNN
ncbi:uncharacterized protein [Trachinotus anak]|uniref:uncharacterized protein n=1 Tax=Trachinotus anak TaxID=443729 RepID=UPI0039F1E7FE